MMTEMMTTVLLASSDASQSGGNWLWLLGPASGVGFYVLTFLRYRNVNKRHAYERETASTVTNSTGYDRKVGHVTDVENDRIRGANSGSPRTRLGAKSDWVEEQPLHQPPIYQPPM